MRILAALLLALVTLPLAAADDVAPVEHDYVVKDFHFASGEVLPEVRIHYTTLGEPRRDAKGVVDNAVLILHGTGGAGHPVLFPHFAGGVFPPGRLPRGARDLILLPGHLGPGRSTQPPGR